jgi:hypothetical protein
VNFIVRPRIGLIALLMFCTIATGCGLDGRTVRVWEIFLLCTSSKPVLGPTQPSIRRELRALSPEVKLAGRGADDSPPKIRIHESIHSTPILHDIVELDLHNNSSVHAACHNGPFFRLDVTSSLVKQDLKNFLRLEDRPPQVVNLKRATG